MNCKGKPVNVLSLFDGMSCGRIALDRAGFEVGSYYASEIDKYAIKVSEANYPDIVRLGDVTKWREWDVDWNSIDLVLAGFPCQSWSTAGKQLGDKDERGMLFWVALDVISKVLERNPNAKFLLENVKMKREFEEYITHHTEQALGVVHKTLINSSLLSAQNRQRYYWANWEFGQPEDKGIVLADILEDGEVDRDKSYCIDANYHKGGNPEQYFNKSRRQLVFNPAAIVGRKLDERGKRNDALDQKPVQCLEVQSHQKSRCLSTVAKDTVISPMKPGRYPLTEKSQTILATLYKENAKSMVKRNKRGLLVCSETEDFGEHETDGLFYRKLTPTECEALQTVPRDYTAAIETLSYSLYNYKEINNKENLYLCDVKLMDAKENREQKSMATYALCTTSDLLGMELINCQRLKAIKSQSVNIAIERLEKKAEGLEECVIDITKTGLDMETLYIQIRSEINLDQEATKSAVMVKTSTERLLRITSEGNCQEVRLFTILIAIRLITQLRICTYVTDRASIHYCIDSLKESQGNLLSVDLSYLKMETTRQTVSNTQRYKMLGNGWTVDVIAHILRGLRDG